MIFSTFIVTTRAPGTSMIEAKHSLTALMVAKRRAAHQLFDDKPLVLDDPIAVPIIGAAEKEQLLAAPQKQQRMIARAGRAMMVARSRYAEEQLARAVDHGVKQYVVLGAGLDTFAYRDPFPPRTLRVFEVDHPATQAWKRERLREAGITLPANLTFVDVHFERVALADRLRTCGFDPTAPAFFSWLGVTMYLTNEAIDSTLAFVASLPSGSGIAMDYSLPTSSLNWIERLIRGYFARKVKRMGEPFVTHFTPEDMRARLTGHGYTGIEDLGHEQLNARYFNGRTDGLRIGGHSLRVVSAWV